jgi:hypothetical protein
MNVSACTKLVLIVLTILAISSATVLIAVPAIYHPTHLVRAERLSQQPDTYFVLENPDAAVVQAIANPQESVTINSLEDTQLDELTNEHNTGNVLVNDRYYQIRIAIGDKFPPPFVTMLYLTSIGALPFSLAAIIVILIKAVKQNLKGNLHKRFKHRDALFAIAF